MRTDPATKAFDDLRNSLEAAREAQAARDDKEQRAEHDRAVRRAPRESRPCYRCGVVAPCTSDAVWCAVCADCRNELKGEL